MNEVLAFLAADFAVLYSPIGRPAIAPEKLLRVMLPSIYLIRSERLLMERLEYGLLFRWFVGIGIECAAWDHSVFSKNRDRLLEGDIASKWTLLETGVGDGFMIQLPVSLDGDPDEGSSRFLGF